MLVYGKYECFARQMLYVCVLCASCASFQCCILHALQFVNAGQGFNFALYLEEGMLLGFDAHNVLSCVVEFLN